MDRPSLGLREDVTRHSNGLSDLHQKPIFQPYCICILQSSYWYTPQPYLVPRLLIDAAQVALHPTKWAARSARWLFLLAAPLSIVRYALQRRPVRWATNLRFRSLPNPDLIPGGSLQKPPAPLTRANQSSGPF